MLPDRPTKAQQLVLSGQTKLQLVLLQQLLGHSLLLPAEMRLLESSWIAAWEVTKTRWVVVLGSLLNKMERGQK